MPDPTRLRELRKAAGFRQADLAALVGVSQPTLSQLESGKLPITLNMMKAVARNLNCAPADLLLAEDDPERLSPDERQIITMYREAGFEQRAIIARIIVPIDYPTVPATDELD